MKPPQSFPPRKQIIWNTRKKSGWEKYKQKTEMNEVFLNLAERTDVDSDVLLKKIEKELVSIKHAAFGKVKVSDKSKDVIKLEKTSGRKEP